MSRADGRPAAPPPATSIGVWGYDVHRHGETNGLRVLPDYDFILIIDGEARWECDGVVHAAPPGSLILARPGMRDDLHWDRVTRSRNFYLHFTPRPLGLPPPQRWPVIRQLPEGDIIRPLLAHLAWLLGERPEGWQTAAAQALELALRAYVTGQLATAHRRHGHLAPLLEAVVAHLSRRWTGSRLAPVSLGELASAAGVSREHLCRVMRSELGCAPVGALRLVRLVRAAELLARPSPSVAAISRTCGFDDPYHFSRAFRAAWGRSPRAWRDAHARGDGSAPPAPAGILALCRRIWEDMPVR